MKRLPLVAVLCILLIFSLIFPAAALAANTDLSNAVLAGGMTHSLCLQEDGSVWVWGSNQQLQLGLDEETKELREPQQLEEITAVVSLAAGHDFSVALRYNGQVYSWGGGISATPVLTPGLNNVVAIAAGQNHILALRSDGTVWQWQLGSVPGRVRGLEGIAAISAGSSHFLALSCVGEVWAWGSNWSGQLGNGTTDDVAVPEKVEGLSNIVSISAGHAHSLAAAYDGTVYAWGANAYGQLGDESQDDSDRPVTVKLAKTVLIDRVSAGNDVSLALSRAGEVYAWGYGEYGQLGVEPIVNFRDKPGLVSGTKDGGAVQIASGVHHGFYIDQEGMLYAWGRNKNYQLGIMRNTNANTPEKVMEGLAFGNTYKVNNLAQASEWFQAELQPLYERGWVPPLLWGDYQENVTRAQFAHMLVAVYEAKNKPASSNRGNLKFADIKNHALETDIVKAYNLGLIDGLSETSFAPDSDITRQEAAKMLCVFVSKLEGTELPGKVENLSFFKDAHKISDWATPFVAYAYSNEIMMGSSGGFAPLGKLTKEQGLAVMARLVERYEW